MQVKLDRRCCCCCWQMLLFLPLLLSELIWWWIGSWFNVKNVDVALCTQFALIYGGDLGPGVPVLCRSALFRYILGPETVNFFCRWLVAALSGKATNQHCLAAWPTQPRNFFCAL